LLTRNDRDHLELIGSFTPGQERLSMSAYAATFAEVAVDAGLGLVRVRRMLGVYDAGRVINPELADSQALGGMIGGIDAALLEHTVTHPRDGRIVNANLADYLVPVNADIPELRAIYLDGRTPRLTRPASRASAKSSRSASHPPSPTPSFGNSPSPPKHSSE
jgi:xanthine dehydrogenase YagR molybdenum-binding subunit